MARRICVREERKKNSVPKKINNWPIAGVTKPNRRRQQAERRLDEGRHAEFDRCGVIAVRIERIAKSAQQVQRIIEERQFILEPRADLRRLADPVAHRGGEKEDQRVQRDDEQHDQKKCGNPLRDAMRRPPFRDRPQHRADDEGGRDGQQQHPGQFEKGAEQKQKNADGRHLRGRAPEAFGAGDRPGLFRLRRTLPRNQPANVHVNSVPARPERPRVQCAITALVARERQGAIAVPSPGRGQWTTDLQNRLCSARSWGKAAITAPFCQGQHVLRTRSQPPRPSGIVTGN